MDTLPQQLSPQRPVLRRGSPAALEVQRRDSFETENQRRLALLAGINCPNCGEPIHFDGSRLYCSNPRDCAYGWSNAEYAEDEIYCGIS